MPEDFMERLYDAGYADGYDAGYRQARIDVEREADEELTKKRVQMREILDIPHNPNRRPTKINTRHSDAIRKESTRRLLNGE